MTGAIGQIRLVNGLVETNIVPGQALLIPLYTYTVQQGDNYDSIARRTFVSAEALQKANPSVTPANMNIDASISFSGNRLNNIVDESVSYVRLI